MDFVSYLEWIPEPCLAWPQVASVVPGPTLPCLHFAPVAEGSFLLLEPATRATTPGVMLANPPDWNVLSPYIHKILSGACSNVTILESPSLITLPKITQTFFHCCCCSVPQSCPTFCVPMDCNTPGFPVFHHFLKFAQTHVN